MGYWLVDRRPGSADDATPGTDLVDELVLHTNGKSRNKNYLHTVLNSMCEHVNKTASKNL